MITVGNKVKSWIEALDLPYQKIKTVYYGDSPVTVDRDVSNIKKELGIKESSRVIALLGRTQQVKGHMILLEALPLLKKTDIHLLFLVKDLDEFPEELEEIKEFIKKNKLEDRVSILGFQKKLGEVMSIIEAGIIPSTASEVNCRVAVEFLSCSIPVISFATGTLPEVIEHGKNGFICDENTGEELAKRIEQLFEDPIAFSTFQKKALQSYEERFTLGQFYQETFEFYDKCSK